MRTLVIGDIHGGLKGLKQVLERASISKEDHLIFLGDYVDGWSDSAATVTFLIALSRKHTCTFIRGNHDDLVHQYLKGKEMSPAWIQHGGQASKDAYDLMGVESKKEHIVFFEHMKDYYVDEENRLFCHAGFQNQNGPEAEWYATAFYWDRTLWETACAMDPSLTTEDMLYPKRMKLFKEIYIGHTPVTRLGMTTPVLKGNVWNIDTGAAFRGPISVMDVQTKEVWQSDNIRELYPDEIGRNKRSYTEKLAQEN